MKKWLEACYSYRYTHNKTPQKSDHQWRGRNAIYARYYINRLYCLYNTQKRASNRRISARDTYNLLLMPADYVCLCLLDVVMSDDCRISPCSFITYPCSVIDVVMSDFLITSFKSWAMMQLSKPSSNLQALASALCVVLYDVDIITVDSRMIALMMSFILSSDFVLDFLLRNGVRKDRGRGGWCFRNLAGVWGCIGTTSAICPQTSIFAFSWLFFVGVANCILGARKSDYNANKRHCWGCLVLWIVLLSW